MIKVPQRTTPVDLEALHLYWWQRTDRRGRLRIEQKGFAEQLGLTRWHLNRLMKQMEAEGRIRPISSQNGARTYVIADPAEWRMRATAI